MKVKISLILIILLASILRIWSLNQYPAGLNADEAAIGYNAYSLLQTGKDEYGDSWPLSFTSFGDYKPGLYFYFVMPFVAVLGLNEWAVRLPAALFGIATILLVYLLGRRIFKNEAIGLLSAGVLALSPWHIHFSRGGWETNVATSFIILGIYFFLLGFEKFKFLFWSMVAFLASMYTYQSPRLIIPILILTLAILYRKELLKFFKRIDNKRSKFWAVGLLGLLGILVIPLVLQFTSGQGSARFSGLSIFSNSGPTARVNELRGEHDNPGATTVQLIHNKITAYGPNFLGHYLDHFRGDFLFVNGDPLIRNKVPETGQFYLIFSLFLVIGLINLIWLKNSYRKLLIAWILIAPIASSITYQTPHALRALNMVVPLSLIIGSGVNVLLGRLRRFGILGKVIIIGIVLLLTFEFIHYLESYYVHYPKRYPLAWEYGFKEMVGKLSQYENQYQKVIITDRYDQPYILVLFYKKYPPEDFQKQAVLSPRDKFNFGTVRNFDDLEFRPIKPDEISQNENVLYIGTAEEILENANIIDRVNFPDGTPAFIFAKGGS